MASISALPRLAKVAKDGAFGGFRDPGTSQKGTFYQFLEDSSDPRAQSNAFWSFPGNLVSKFVSTLLPGAPSELDFKATTPPKKQNKNSEMGGRSRGFPCRSSLIPCWTRSGLLPAAAFLLKGAAMREGGNLSIPISLGFCFGLGYRLAFLCYGLVLYFPSHNSFILFNRNWILVPVMISTATGSVSVRPNCGEDPSLLHHLGKAPLFLFNPDRVALRYSRVY
jgi:hypothetical protein